MAKHRYTNEEVEQWRRENKRTMYANPDDKRIMVPKVSGLGLTPNWANPLGWVVLVLIVAVIVVIRLFVGRLFGRG